MNIHRRHTSRTRSIVRRIAVITASVALLAGFAACSDDSAGTRSADRPSLTERLNGADTDEGGTQESSEAPHTEGAAPDADSGSTADDNAPESGAATEGSRAPGNERRRAAPTERSVIQKGNVSVASDDVGDARFDAKDVVDRHSGEIAEEETGTDDGEVSRVRMEIRVPQQAFDALMTDLSELGDLKSSTRSSEDVSTQVIDTRSRLKTQERSIARIQSLLASAEDLEQIVSIESQLADRQADLESLKAQLAWLEDQSSLSTVTLSLSPAEEQTTEEDEQETGFVPGLKEGWSAFTAAVSGLATGVGAFLPFGITLLLLVTPLWIWGRRRTARRRQAVAA